VREMWKGTVRHVDEHCQKSQLSLIFFPVLYFTVLDEGDIEILKTYVS